MSYWMLYGKPTRYDSLIGLAGIVAGVMVGSAMYSFHQEYGGGGSVSP